MNDQERYAIHQLAKTKGFWDADKTPDFWLAKMCLIHSEVSEVMEAYRKNMGSYKIMEEFADIFIRCYDLIEGMHEEGILEDYDIHKAIRRKTATNRMRPDKHGNLI